ncbi:MAG: MarR family transcriptional regulator, partial [Lachnospiraceae bacterium]|nr:MarR family transcriptional regulator [Lachnospiraceae bacterium]
DIYRNLAKILGLSECSFWILYTLRTNDTELVQSEVCAYMYQPKQTINSALKKMESDGYIKLEQGNDHRSKRISLTAGGIRLCERTVDRVIESERGALECMTAEEQELFLSLFHKYTDLLKQAMQDISQKE